MRSLVRAILTSAFVALISVLPAYASMCGTTFNFKYDFKNFGEESDHEDSNVRVDCGDNKIEITDPDKQYEFDIQSSSIVFKALSGGLYRQDSDGVATIMLSGLNWGKKKGKITGFDYIPKKMPNAPEGVKVTDFVVTSSSVIITPTANWLMVPEDGYRLDLKVQHVPLASSGLLLLSVLLAGAAARLGISSRV